MCHFFFFFLFQSWGLAKVQSNRSSLQPMIDEICDIVRSEQFIASLLTLGLRSPAEASCQSPRESCFSSGASSVTTKYAQVCVILELRILVHSYWQIFNSLLTDVGECSYFFFLFGLGILCGHGHLLSLVFLNKTMD